MVPWDLGFAVRNQAQGGCCSKAGYERCLPDLSQSCSRAGGVKPFVLVCFGLLCFGLVWFVLFFCVLFKSTLSILCESRPRERACWMRTTPWRRKSLTRRRWAFAPFFWSPAFLFLWVLKSSRSTSGYLFIYYMLDFKVLLAYGVYRTHMCGHCIWYIHDPHQIHDMR